MHRRESSEFERERRGEREREREERLDHLYSSMIIHQLNDSRDEKEEKIMYANELISVEKMRNVDTEEVRGRSRDHHRKGERGKGKGGGEG